jgi:predicted transposase YdaD
VVASDKLFFWLFQGRSDRLQPLVAELIDSMEGYSFSAPAIKELEVRLDGLFLPPPEQLAEKPALILEAQMAAAPDFLLRLYSESALLLRHQHRQGQPLRHWRVVVICPSRDLAFGDPVPVREFLEERVLWIELAPERLPPEAPPLQRALGLLLLPEAQVSASATAIRRSAAGTTLSGEIDTVIAAILVARFSGRSIPELCAMGGITLDDFTSSAIYKEIFGLGQDQGRQAEAAALTVRQLQRRCGTLSSQQQARIQALALPRLEALADALLDFQGPQDLAAWLEAQER